MKKGGRKKSDEEKVIELKEKIDKKSERMSKS